ncbi:hypothetical protein [Halobacillus sp. BAB-2008]|uniref:hypothetical protein n=1 Tax=Halobacillus sp. BAB-2008 TaxID=1246484 RepID=UPI0002A4D36D|nr:hypothetical protein [Halobacillus sp. BAB-2008]ELK46419.1 hypothetical protein D479_10606 [Halobacillus sp. BAB-2008]
MYAFYFGIILAVSVTALIGTVWIARSVSKEEENPSYENDVNNLKDDRRNSSSIPLLSTIYAITFAVTIVLVWIFIF